MYLFVVDTQRSEAGLRTIANLQAGLQAAAADIELGAIREVQPRVHLTVRGAWLRGQSPAEAAYEQHLLQ
eukprot:5918069-Pyramimonas_sp.AAC.1